MEKIFEKFSVKTSEDVLKEFKTQSKGLSDPEARKRLSQYGENNIEGKETTAGEIFLRQFHSPFIYLLVVAVAVSFFLSELVDGIIIIGFIIINTVLGFLEEWHSAKALKLLKQYVVATTRVLRSGKLKNIPTKELVTGDIVQLEAGDLLAADVRFLSCQNLVINESVLTGEAVAVNKISTKLGQHPQAVHEAQNTGFSGTTVESGEALAVVIATGQNTEFGKIAHLIAQTSETSTFEKNISKFSRFIMRMILVILALMLIFNLILKGDGVDVWELLLFSLALAVSVVPEALPVVTTIALSKGAARLAKRKVVVKRLSAVEDLGSIEVLCTDKTGTLTENILSVHSLYSKEEAQTIFLSVLTSEVWKKCHHDANNAFDLALWKKLEPQQKNYLQKCQKIQEYPFDPKRKRNSALIKTPKGKLLVVRGAPEVILSLCLKLSKTEKKKIMKWICQEGCDGRRVLAVAYKNYLNSKNYKEADEKNLTYGGCVSFIDPIKESALNAIKQARKLGVKIKILTGDSVEVATSVGRQVGLAEKSVGISGAEFFKLTENEQQRVLEENNIFARVSPEQKFELIKLLQKKYEVGYLGEGINDAAALKIADVGIVVNDAADISREAADIVLLKKSLEIIVDGVAEGRKIFTNTIKYIKATLISNFGNFYAIAVASLLVAYVPMLPVQILLLNLISDFPMIAIATDRVDTPELKKPRSYNIKEVVLVALVLGLVSTIFDFIFFGIFYNDGPAVLRTNWFIGSVLTELVLIFSIRTQKFFIFSRRPSFLLSFLSVMAVVVALGAVFSQFGQEFFGFIRPTIQQFGVVIIVVIIYFCVTEIVKNLYYRSVNGAAIKK